MPSSELPCSFPVLPKLTLHPVHVAKGGSRAVKRLSIDSKSPKDECRALLLSHMSEYVKPKGVDGPLVTIQQDRLLVQETLGCHHQEIPLLMAEVSSIADIEPRPVVLVMLENDSNLEPSKTNVWVLDVGMPDLELTMVLLTTRGAFRTDMRAVIRAHPDVVGEGAFSSIYKAAPIKAGGIHPENLVVKEMGFAKNEDHVRSEVGCLAKLPTHANIGHLLGFFFDTGGSQACLIFEYHHGGDLFDFVLKKGPCTEPEAIWILHSLLMGVAHIHKHGILHRDIKPENITLKQGGEAVLIDFGIACSLSDDDEMQRSCGSIGYVAPEVILKERYGVKADIFGLGATTFFMFTGIGPFRGPNIHATMRATLRGEAGLSFDDHVQLKLLSVSTEQIMRSLMQHRAKKRPTAEVSLAFVQDRLDADAVGDRLLSLGVPRDQHRRRQDPASLGVVDRGAESHSHLSLVQDDECNLRTGIVSSDADQVYSPVVREDATVQDGEVNKSVDAGTGTMTCDVGEHGDGNSLQHTSDASKKQHDQEFARDGSTRMTLHSRSSSGGYMDGSSCSETVASLSNGKPSQKQDLSAASNEQKEQFLAEAELHPTSQDHSSPDYTRSMDAEMQLSPTPKAPCKKHFQSAAARLIEEEEEEARAKFAHDGGRARQGGLNPQLPPIPSNQGIDMSSGKFLSDPGVSQSRASSSHEAMPAPNAAVLSPVVQPENLRRASIDVASRAAKDSDPPPPTDLRSLAHTDTTSTGPDAMAPNPPSPKAPSGHFERRRPRKDPSRYSTA